MNPAILDAAVQEYIDANLEANLKTLVFKSSPFKLITMPELVAQIAAKKIAVKKLPEYFNTKNIIYPPKKNLEQSSSQLTAVYKASLIQGTTAADITGGYGIDSYFVSKSFKSFDYYEHQPDLCKIAKHNFNQLNASAINVINMDGLAGIANKNYDWIYCDPDRRSSGKKAFRFEDCSPDLSTDLEKIMARCNSLLVKTSPLLDITQALKTLSGVTAIHALAVKGELKELLFVVSNQVTTTIDLFAVDCTANKTWTVSSELGEQAQVTLSMPEKYLYIPNAAIMKLQLFGNICAKYKLHKLHKHSHFFTNNTIIAFPGRTFKVLEVLPYTKNSMKAIQGGDYLVIARNFPQSVAQLRKRWKLHDKGSNYLVFTTLTNGNKAVLKCEMV